MIAGFVLAAVINTVRASSSHNHHWQYIRDQAPGRNRSAGFLIVRSLIVSSDLLNGLCSSFPNQVQARFQPALPELFVFSSHCSPFFAPAAAKRDRT